MRLRTTRLPILGILVAALLSVSGTRATTPQFVDVAPGVVAALQPQANRFNDSNVTILIGSEAVMVVDAPTDEEFVRAVIAEVRKRTELPIRYVVNTHWHADHTQGNALYLEAFPELTLLGHKSLEETIPGRAQQAHQEQVERYEEMVPKALANLEKGLGLRDQPLDEEQQQAQAAAIEQAQQWLVENKSFQFITPTVRYHERMQIELGGLEVSLLHFKAHTDGDTVLWLPKQMVLITGDMLDDLPYVGHGFPSSWLEALDELAGLEASKTIPGHGPIFDGDAQRAKLRDFVAALIASAEGAESAEQARERFDADDWRKKLAGEDPTGVRFFNAVLGEALERALSGL